LLEITSKNRPTGESKGQRVLEIYSRGMQGLLGDNLLLCLFKPYPALHCLPTTPFSKGTLYSSMSPPCRTPWQYVHGFDRVIPHCPSNLSYSKVVEYHQVKNRHQKRATPLLKDRIIHLLLR
jgi:hypothetical protein